MTDNTEPHGTDDETTPHGDENSTTTPQGDAAPDDRLKAESRKWEARAKANAKELADLKAAMKSVLTPEQAADKDAQLQAAIAEANKASLQATKYRVALSEGLPIDLADRLVGDDEDELRKDAEKLKALVKPPAPGSDAKKGGGAKTPDASKPTANELLRMLAKG